ncbi:MAG: ABC transporter ATP-binding protein [Thaumarchaeota archaeon]|nr:ABC transporter ATP-binding protein [Nitrososphaerota archaeon]
MDMSEKITVDVRDVAKIYGNQTEALRGVSLVIEKGEMVSIIGQSGSGKTTLLNIIGGLDKPSKGAVYINGIDIAKLSRNELAKFRRENIGFVFQQFHLILYLTALENVMLAQYFHSMADEEEAKHALEAVGLGHRVGHLPSQLSSGEQQRVCIARALINEPKLLLADEPTGNLDQANSKNIMELFKKLHQQQNITIILVTHDPSIAETAKRTIKVTDGTISQGSV